MIPNRKTTKTLKRASVILMAGLMATQLAGCSTIKGLTSKDNEDKPSYEELEQQIGQLNSSVVAKNNEILSLKELLYTYDNSLSEVADLNSVRRLPTGVKAYNGINNYIRLGEQLELKPSMVLPNDTTIQLVKNVEYKPSNNWSFDLSNGTVSLLHKNGMYVTLRAYNYIGKSTPYDIYDTILKPYLKNLSMVELNRRTLFMKDQTCGTLVFNQCYVVEQELNGVTADRTLKLPIQETEPQTEAETQPQGETQAETQGETQGETQAQVSISPHKLPIVADTQPSTETAEETKAKGLDDLINNPSEGETTEEIPESTEETTADTQEKQPTQEEAKVTEKVTEYRYVVGVVLDGSTGIIFEAFYPNDDTASIQEELLETCLNGLYIRGNQLKSQ